jgi:hypothetical protein
MYRRGADGCVESRLFADIRDVPKTEGWVDSPAAITRGRPKRASHRKEK